MSAHAVVALDVGGTSVKAARIDATGAVLAESAIPTPVHDGADRLVTAISGLAERLSTPDTAAVAVAVPGVVDPGEGIARYSANLGWRDVPLRERLTARLRRPVVVDHDVRAAAYAERTIGRARNAPDCLVVVVGTGVAGVLCAGGAPVHGARGMAGEIGHLPVHPDGAACACGQRGCTEVYASAAGIARRYAERTGVARTAEQVAGSLAADPDAAAIWAEAAEALGLALAHCTLLLDPSLVVLAGGLARAGEVLREPVGTALSGRLAWRPAPQLEISPLGHRAGLYGAALLAWQAAGRDVRAGWPLN